MSSTFSFGSVANRIRLAPSIRPKYLSTRDNRNFESEIAAEGFGYLSSQDIIRHTVSLMIPRLQQQVLQNDPVPLNAR